MTCPAHSDAAKLLAQLGAKKGGLARAKALTPERRQEIARKAGKTPKRTRQPKETTMLTIVNAWNQQGWSGNDHLLDDTALTNLIGRTYKSFAALRAAAQKAAQSYPTVEYSDGQRRYRYDGSPQGIPGRHVRAVTDLGAV